MQLGVIATPKALRGLRDLQGQDSSARDAITPPAGESADHFNQHWTFLSSRPNLPSRPLLTIFRSHGQRASAFHFNHMKDPHHGEQALITRTGSAFVFIKVRGSAANEVRVIAKAANSLIARSAKKGADLASGMAVVDSQVLGPAASRGTFWQPADRAATVLIAI